MRIQETPQDLFEESKLETEVREIKKQRKIDQSMGSPQLKSFDRSKGPLDVWNDRQEQEKQFSVQISKQYSKLKNTLDDSYDENSLSDQYDILQPHRSSYKTVKYQMLTDDEYSEEDDESDEELSAYGFKEESSVIEMEKEIPLPNKKALKQVEDEKFMKQNLVRRNSQIGDNINALGVKSELNLPESQSDDQPKKIEDTLEQNVEEQEQFMDRYLGKEQANRESVANSTEVDEMELSQFEPTDFAQPMQGMQTFN